MRQTRKGSVREWAVLPGNSFIIHRQYDLMIKWIIGIVKIDKVCFETQPRGIDNGSERGGGIGIIVFLQIYFSKQGLYCYGRNFSFCGSQLLGSSVGVDILGIVKIGDNKIIDLIC